MSLIWGSGLSVSQRPIVLICLTFRLKVHRKAYIVYTVRDLVKNLHSDSGSLGVDIRVYVYFYLFCFVGFETGFSPQVRLTQSSVYHKLALNSWQLSCFSLPSAGMTGIRHHTQQPSVSLTVSLTLRSSRGLSFPGTL